MMTITSRQRAFAVLAVPLTVAGLVVASAMYFVADWQARVDKRFADIAFKYARLEGVLRAGANLEVASHSALAELKAQVYPASQDSVKAGNDLLQRMRALAEARGMVVISSQVLPPPESKKFDQVRAELTGNVSIGALQQLLRAVRAEQPAMAIDELQLTPVRRGSEHEPQVLLCRIVAFSLRMPK
jgi:hypothetical protein